MKKRLKEQLLKHLSADELASVYNSYDIIGDIAVIRLPEVAKARSQTIAEAIMNIHKNVETVLAQTSPVAGDFRLRKLEFVAGENKSSTVHRESGCMFFVDVKECYFSPRLFHERMRIAKQVTNGEVIVNMFAGVGCFSIIIAKHSNAAKIYSIDINPVAVENMRKNIRLNRLNGIVLPILGEAKKVIEERLRHVADRVLMPLPEKACEYLPYALLTLKRNCGWIHYYDFEYAKKNENPIEKVMQKLTERLRSLGATFTIPYGRVVRSIGPHWYQVVLDINLT